MTTINILAICFFVVVVIFSFILVGILESLSRHRKMIKFIDEDVQKARGAVDVWREHLGNYFTILRDWKDYREEKEKKEEEKQEAEKKENVKIMEEIIRETSEIKDDIKVSN